MNLIVVVLGAMAILGLAYWGYGGLLARLLKLDSRAETPAVALRDDVDYAPIAPKFLLTQHLSAIAAAGPIVGPILAGVMFGWVPALLWILVGCVLIGGVHDLTALVASVRHRARSIAEVVQEHMSKRSYVIFLAFVWIALVYIIVAFTDITASSFVGVQTLENGNRVSGGAVATSSLLYLALPVIMGLLMRYAKLTLGWATLIFLPLVGVAIWAGPHLPFELGRLTGLDDAGAQKLWDVLLLVYCYAASIVPMWLLLQPRGHLGGYFLLLAMGGGALGLVFGRHAIEYPAFVGWSTPRGESLFPVLFITIACGACSGFHAIIASGTSSKQLRRETDAVPVGYGSMLLEGLVAVISLCCVMMLGRDAAALRNPQPNFIYAQGIGRFLEVIGIPAAFGVSFGLMAFTTFVYDTLDVCTRLGRYIVEELTGWHGKAGKWIATAITAGLPLLFVMQKTVDSQGHAVPAWKVFWALFGASNQLLAALTLLGVTVWLWRTRRARWVWWVTGLPTAWMYVMSVWALGQMIVAGFGGNGAGICLTAQPVPWVALVLVALAALMLVEAIRALWSSRGAPPTAAGLAPAVVQYPG